MVMQSHTGKRDLNLLYLFLKIFHLFTLAALGLLVEESGSCSLAAVCGLLWLWSRL